MKRTRSGSQRYATMKHVHCPHCNKMIQQKTSEEHRKLYYSVEKSEWSWSKQISLGVLSDSESDSEYTGDLMSPPSDTSTLSLDDSLLEFADMEDINPSSDHSDMDDVPQRDLPTSPLESSAGEEDWDESDIEIPQKVSSSATECEPNLQVKAFSVWIVRLLLAFQAVYKVPYQATQWLFMFLHMVLKTRLSIAPTPFLEYLVTVIPTSLYTAWKSVKLEKDEFIRYVVCPKCNSIYAYEDCIVKCGLQLKSKACSFVVFKDHPNARYRRPCNTNLLKTIHFRNGTTKLVPRKEYPYMSIVQTIKMFLKRPNCGKLPK